MLHRMNPIHWMPRSVLSLPPSLYLDLYLYLWLYVSVFISISIAIYIYISVSCTKQNGKENTIHSFPSDYYRHFLWARHYFEYKSAFKKCTFTFLKTTFIEHSFYAIKFTHLRVQFVLSLKAQGSVSPTTVNTQNISITRRSLLGRLCSQSLVPPLSCNQQLI